jgi:multiple sugar transport system substrate-binding protein
MLIASSGDAETNAVKAATEAWAKKSGNTVTVTVASDMNQQLAQGFASGSPADVFYLDAGRFADYAKNGSLFAYADQLKDNDDFYESLRQAFTFETSSTASRRTSPPWPCRSTPTPGPRPA